ncbi:MAG: DUF6850 family outer membrane beta-barrel protein [Marinifilaceae bacterium]
MRKLFTLLLTLIALPLLAQDTTTITRVVAQHEQLNYLLHPERETPMQWFLIQRQPYVALSGQWQSVGTGGVARPVQLGTGENAFSINFSNFTVIDTVHRFYSAARYLNGRTNGVQYNLTTDFERLFPYITGDTSVGKMNREHYLFTLGYLYVNNRWTLGTQLDYTAKNEYRRVDPRPHNTTSDMALTATAAYAITPRYYASLSGAWTRYTQKNSIAFMAESGKTHVSHYLGFGVEHPRFSGTNNDVFFRGSGAKVSFTLAAPDYNGWHFTLGYGRENMEKLLTSLNDLKLNTTHHTTLHATVGYTGQTATTLWGVEASVQRDKRTGDEHMYGESSANAYPQIGTTSPFLMENMAGTLRLMWEHRNNGRAIGLSPYAQYDKLETSRETDYWHYNRLTTGSVLSASLPIRSALLAIEGNAAYNLYSGVTYSNNPLSHLTEQLTRNGFSTSARATLYVPLNPRICMDFHTGVSYLQTLGNMANSLGWDAGIGFLF